MKKRTPRPKMLGFYVSEAERQMIAQNADALGMSISAYLRYLAIQDDRERSTVQLTPKKRVAEYAQ